MNQDEVMAQARLVVCHGGAGTTLGALVAGVPMVVFQLFADQADNGRCVVAAGAGIAVEARGAAAANRTVGPEDTAALREAPLQVLHDPAFAEASARARSAFTALPLIGDIYDGLMTELHTG